MIVSRIVIGTLVVVVTAFSLVVAWPLFAIVLGIIVVMKAAALRETLGASGAHAPRSLAVMPVADAEARAGRV